MAIYQFYLAVIPKAGLLHKHEQIPNEIKVSTETGYFESNTEEYWELAGIPSEPIIQAIDTLVNKANWGNDNSYFNWKTYTDVLDNDASMSTNETSGNIIELSFRADLREKDLQFLKGMIELGKQYDWLFMDRKGNLAEPDSIEIGRLIEMSNSYKFLQDPTKFLTDLLKDKK